MKKALKNAWYVCPLPLIHQELDSALTFPSPTSLAPSYRDSSTKRAFQTMPRHLRRRAASHNARRVPSRLRAKAAAEVRLCCSSATDKSGLTFAPVASDVADRPQDQEEEALSSQEGDSKDWHVVDGEVPPTPTYVSSASVLRAPLLTSFSVWVHQATSSGWIRTSGWQRGCTWSTSGASDW